ncbi:dTMP kinase, partial [Candidatus Bathyarchaeota archaeon]|nr:dTMP kinase [Candidatus Bathyarchaeota archaeon]
MAKKGFFICIEGLDGCGKTTQTKTLVKNLQ